MCFYPFLHCAFHATLGKLFSAKIFSAKKGGMNGAEGDRTPDLGLAKPALSQLSYSPKKNKKSRVPA